jgi:hypothetical protein
MGVLLWEMYTGLRPWSGMMQMQVIFNITVLHTTLVFPEDTPAALKVGQPGAVHKDRCLHPRDMLTLFLLMDAGVGDGMHALRTSNTTNLPPGRSRATGVEGTIVELGNHELTGFLGVVTATAFVHFKEHHYERRLLTPLPQMEKIRTQLQFLSTTARQARFWQEMLPEPAEPVQQLVEYA